MSDQLRERIVDSGRSLYELGRSAGVAPSVLSRFLRGERGLSLVSVDKLCRALGLNLTGGEAPRYP
jgi:hypothetical protein